MDFCEIYNSRYGHMSWHEQFNFYFNKYLMVFYIKQYHKGVKCYIQNFKTILCFVGIEHNYLKLHPSIYYLGFVIKVLWNYYKNIFNKWNKINLSQFFFFFLNKIKGNVKVNKEIGNTKRERDFSIMDVIFCFFVFEREGIKLYECD